jgi:hypothetical protein
MDVVEVLNSEPVRLVVLPTVAVVVTVLVRRVATPPDPGRYKLFSRDTWAVGFDLLVGAALGGLALLLERARVLGSQGAAEVPGAAAASLVWPALVAVGTLVAALFVGLVVSDYGYDPPATRRGPRRLRLVRGVLFPLVTGTASLAFLLGAAR